MKFTILALFLSAHFAYAENLPDLGDQSQVLLSPQQEKAVAQDALRYLRMSRQWLGDAEVNGYLNQIVAKIVLANPEIKQNFTPVGLQDETINAFAVPGGAIGVHTGLILASQNESELAGVMSHEMAHVTQHHMSRLMEAQQRTLWPTLAAMAAAILLARSNGDISTAGIAAAQAYNVQNTLDFTRTHEREADRIGMRYLQQSGFDPRGMPDFFNRLQQKNRFNESNAPNYLRTHPITQERIADAESRLNDLPYHQYPNSIEYLLIKEKIRVLTLPKAQLEGEFAARLAGNSGQNLLVTQYGLARLKLKERDTTGAWSLAEPLLKKLTHPMVSLLAAEILIARQQPLAARAILEEALKTTAESAPLQETLIQALTEAKDGNAALAAVHDYQRQFPEALDAWEWKANIHHQLGQKAESHLALAEFYWRLGASGDAMRQLRIAKAQGNLSTYLAARIDSRLKIMQQEAPSPR